MTPVIQHQHGILSQVAAKDVDVGEVLTEFSSPRRAL